MVAKMVRQEIDRAIKTVWLDHRGTEHWANGRMTELDAGYLDGVMTFEVNSYTQMNFRNKSTSCQMFW